MNKKKFDVPQVFLSTAQLNDWGGYSNNGEMSIKPVPMSFGEWTQSRWCADYDGNGNVTVEDFNKWWAMTNLGEEAFMQFNPGLDWNPDVSK